MTINNKEFQVDKFAEFSAHTGHNIFSIFAAMVWVFELHNLQKSLAGTQVGAGSQNHSCGCLLCGQF